jgi:hypothetical protein
VSVGGDRGRGQQTDGQGGARERAQDERHVRGFLPTPVR